MNDLIPTTDDLKLFMVLIGSKGPGRNVEQHDYFFGIARSVKDLVPDMKAFWPEAARSMHLDGWREVNKVDGYEVKIIPKSETVQAGSPKLFFINLGGYQANTLQEQHYVVLSVKDDRAMAIKDSKTTVFYKTNSIKGANSHIDEKYGIDVDDIYKIEDILSPEMKSKYQILITPDSDLPEDEIKLGYFQLHKL